MNIREFILKFEELYPKSFSYQWDNVGLQIGSSDIEISNILVSLDLTAHVVDEAISNRANLIVVHHPIIFSPIKQINLDSYFGKLISKIIKNNINIYVAHTNFDISNFGMNKILADLLGLQNQQLIEMETDKEGLGRYGNLLESLPLNKFIEVVKTVFKINSARLIGNTDPFEKVQTIAITGGSGSSLLSSSILSKCDVYVTGDITYHHALDAINNGLTVLDVGHNIEKNALPKLCEIISEFSSDYKVYLSQVNTDPYKIV